MLTIYKWPQTDAKIKKKIMGRAMLEISNIREYVAEWIETIKKEGDAGIEKYIRQYDNKYFKIEELKVTKSDIEKAYLAQDDPEALPLSMILTSEMVARYEGVGIQVCDDRILLGQAPSQWQGRSESGPPCRRAPRCGRGPCWAP